MKITINLTEQEVNALKAYLKEVSHDINPVISKANIEMEIKGAVSGHLQAGSLGDYYNQYVNQYWDAQNWFNKQLNISAAVSYRNQYYPDLKVNEFLTGTQIEHIYKSVVLS